MINLLKKQRKDLQIVIIIITLINVVPAVFLDFVFVCLLNENLIIKQSTYVCGL